MERSDAPPSAAATGSHEPSTSAPPLASGVLDTVGGTPLVPLRDFSPPDAADVYLKLEYFNPTGSHKDRMARSMVEEAEARGDLRPGMTVVEYTGGSTGSALAFVCAARGYRLRIVSADAFAREKIQTMRALGAEVELLEAGDEGITGQLMERMIERAGELAGDPETYFTDQFRNRDALEGYRALGREIVEQMDRPVDGLCAAVGTAGMLMGCAEGIRDRGGAPRVVALEPTEAAAITGEGGGSHGVEGVGVGFVPPLLDREACHAVWTVEEAEARETARALARRAGILAGTSTGMNLAGARRLAREIGAGGAVVTVACDTGLKYLAGTLFREA